jgi:hypothetical protein
MLQLHEISSGTEEELLVYTSKRFKLWYLHGISK